MPPDGCLERRFVQVPDAVFFALRRDVQRHLGQKQVRADPRGCVDARFGEHGVHEHAGERPRVGAVEGQVGRGVDEAFVYGVRMQVVGGHVAQVGAVLEYVEGMQVVKAFGLAGKQNKSSKKRLMKPLPKIALLERIRLICLARLPSRTQANLR